MSRKAVSARGDVVDFDLLKLKSEILKQKPSRQVVERQQQIEERRKRRYVRRKKAEESKAEATEASPSSEKRKRPKNQPKEK